MNRPFPDTKRYLHHQVLSVAQTGPQTYLPWLDLPHLKSSLNYLSKDSDHDLWPRYSETCNRCTPAGLVALYGESAPAAQQWLLI